jgi:hypothetical protein
MLGELKEIEDLFEVGESYNFVTSQLVNSNDVNVNRKENYRSVN